VLLGVCSGRNWCCSWKEKGKGGVNWQNFGAIFYVTSHNTWKKSENAHDFLEERGGGSQMRDGVGIAGGLMKKKLVGREQV